MYLSILQKNESQNKSRLPFPNLIAKAKHYKLKNSVLELALPLIDYTILHLFHFLENEI